jgi:hypothetical protein
LNPGSHTPQACILNHARRRPHKDKCLKEQKPIKKPISPEILHLIDKAVTEVRNNRKLRNKIALLDFEIKDFEAKLRKMAKKEDTKWALAF